MKNKKQLRIEQAYEKVARENPDAPNQRVLELLTRDYLFNQKKLRVAKFFISGAIIQLIGFTLTWVDHPFILFLSALGIIIGSLLSLVSVFMLYKMLHDPLTPNEAKELRDFDAVEKGRQNIDLSQYDNSSYNSYMQQHMQQKYDNASRYGKLKLRFARLPLIAQIFLFMIFCGVLMIIFILLINLFIN